MNNEDRSTRESLKIIAAFTIILIMLGCAPAVVIAVWRALL